MRGLLMVECLYHQTILGNKTQTRRSGGLEAVNEHPNYYVRMSRMVDVNKLAKEYANKTPEHYMVSFAHKEFGGCIKCTSRYKVGEVLYIKEPYMGQNGHYSYKYDLKENSPLRNGNGSTVVWKNKLFMPTEAARAFIRITGIKCERLLDISDSDCLAEGIHKHHLMSDKWINYLYPQKGIFTHGKQPDEVIFKKHAKGKWLLSAHCETPKESFLSLYKFANKVKEVPNLFVWCYQFEYLPNYKI